MTGPIVGRDCGRARSQRCDSLGLPGRAVADAAATAEPHKLAGFLFGELASSFTTFYEQCPGPDCRGKRDAAEPAGPQPALTLRVLVTWPRPARHGSARADVGTRPQPKNVNTGSFLVAVPGKLTARPTALPMIAWGSADGHATAWTTWTPLSLTPSTRRARPRLDGAGPEPDQASWNCTDRIGHRGRRGPARQRRGHWRSADGRRVGLHRRPVLAQRQPDVDQPRCRQHVGRRIRQHDRVFGGGRAMRQARAAAAR